MDPDAAFVIGGGLLTSVFSMAMIVVGIYMVQQARTRREAQRLEFHARLLERVGSAREFGEFLATDSGQRFLDALTPESARPHARMLAAVRGGVILLVLSIGVLAGLESGAFARQDELVGDLVIVAAAAGIGLLLAALTSYVIARRLGVLDPGARSTGSRPPQV